jgi:hypothetical protein
MSDTQMAPAFLVLGVAIALYGIFNPGPYYNDADMPLTPEETEDRAPASYATTIYLRSMRHFYGCMGTL